MSIKIFSKSTIIRSLGARSKGQSLVEFALSATLMIFLLLATIDFGLAFFSWISLRDAAQEGATFGSIFPPLNAGDTAALDAIRLRVKSAATTPVNLGTLTDGQIVITVFDASNNWTPCPGSGVRVTVTYPYRVITPMISSFINSPTIPVTATVTNTILRRGNNAVCP